MSPDEIIRLLALEPLPFEGGFFRQTYKSNQRGGDRALATAIYYLVTPENFSAWHRVKSDELFHFYLGDPVELWQIPASGEAEMNILGTGLLQGMRPQALVPRDTWQALRLAGGGKSALLGTTVSPGFEYEDFELGTRENLSRAYPSHRNLVEELTRA